jgi:hypothetical protein
MTKQNKHLIELSDLLAFTFTCRNEKCGAIFSISTLGSTETARFDKCPACDEPWLTLSGGDTLYPIFSEFRSALKKLRLGIEQRNSFSFAIEISSDPSSGDKD